jgi:nicotinamidase-related amidase
MAGTALLILDMMNRFDFPGGEVLARKSVPVAKTIKKLKSRFQRKDLPVIYVNDNCGEWRSDWRRIFNMCSEPKARGREVARILRPDPTDYFILKPKHSGFYMTTLELLLAELDVSQLVLTGVAGNICVLFTAHDAHMREFDVVVPRDCIASNSETDTRFALRQLKTALKISIERSEDVRLFGMSR